MIPPALALLRFFYGLLVGMALGVFYGFLRPLRQRHTTIGDLLFLPAAVYGWLFLHFDLCRTDIRMAYSVAVLIGIFAWESTIGCLLRPVFSKLWIIVEKIWGLLLFPFKQDSAAVPA